MHDRRIADIEKALIAGEDGREKKWSDENIPGKLEEWMYPKDPWTLQWRGWNLYDAGVWALKIGIFEGSGYLG